MEDIIVLLIPIFTVLGTFTAIAFGIYFRYKTDSKILESIPADSLGEWYAAKARERAIRRRGSAFRWGGFLVGAGLGTAVGCIVLACGGIPQNLRFDENAIATFLIIALALFLGGAGMIGAYFLENRLGRKA